MKMSMINIALMLFLICPLFANKILEIPFEHPTLNGNKKLLVELDSNNLFSIKFFKDNALFSLGYGEYYHDEVANQITLNVNSLGFSRSKALHTFAYTMDSRAFYIMKDTVLKIRQQSPNSACLIDTDNKLMIEKRNDSTNQNEEVIEDVTDEIGINAKDCIFFMDDFGIVVHKSDNSLRIFVGDQWIFIRGIKTDLEKGSVVSSGELIGNVCSDFKFVRYTYRLANFVPVRYERDLCHIND